MSPIPSFGWNDDRPPALDAANLEADRASIGAYIDQLRADLIAGMAVTRKFPFAFNTPGLLTGHAVYTPTIGDLLLGAWIEVDTAWDGTTPKGDVGQFTGGVAGWIKVAANAPADMTLEWTNGLPGAGTGMLFSIDGNVTTGEFAYYSGGAKFLTADPIKVVVSQNGTNTGASPGSTQGAAILYLMTVTPR